MAEFQKVIKEKERICDRYVCALCPLGKCHQLSSEHCSRWVIANPKQAESIIMKWAKENPIQTNGMKFEEVFGSSAVVVWYYEFTAFSKWMDAEYKGEQDDNT